jgi:PilZ domain
MNLRSREKMVQASTTGVQRKKEARQLLRYGGGLPLKVTREGLSGPMSINGHCTDIGEAGLGAELECLLVIGEIVSLTFALPNVTEMFDLKARVLYRNGNRYGFYFLGISEWQRLELMRGCELMKA